ncbi:MAG: nucleotidyltransferase family protein [Candidatus Parcubacteria bacterium]|nr:nucleotidyltransferase family protein [Candidatus Parcubacteria bacterium]
MNQELNEIKKKIEPVLKKYPVSYAGVFGSFARGDEKKNSDFDVMIRIKPKSNFSLFDLIGMERELARKIGRKVDLTTEKSIGPYIKNSVFRDLKPIYET